MTTPTLTITDRVQAGAAWLDENRPGWWQRIDLDALSLGEPCYCVLGQEFADEAETWQTGYELGVGWLDDGHQSAPALGFAAELHGEASAEFWDTLTAAWRELILARRAGTEATR